MKENIFLEIIFHRRAMFPFNIKLNLKEINFNKVLFGTRF